MSLKKVVLSNGVEMPMLGLGTWKASAEDTKGAIAAALEVGYVLFDTANDYDNEHVIGQVLEGVDRSKLFIQCKLWNSNHRPEHVRGDLMATLKDLRVSYVDSFIIHWPQAVPSQCRLAVRTDGSYPAPREQNTMFPVDEDGTYCVDASSHYIETWKKMEELVDEGLCKSIGLSNFNATQTREVYEAARIKPAVNQCECHPYLQQKDLLDVCRSMDIVFQAYSPLGSNDSPFRRPEHPSVFTDAVLAQVASKHDKSVAQVVLRWHLQRGVSCVPKSVTPERIRQNIDVFDFALDDEDMKQIARLNQGLRMLPWRASSNHRDYPFELPYDYVLEKAPDRTK